MTPIAVTPPLRILDTTANAECDQKCVFNSSVRSEVAAINGDISKFIEERVSRVFYLGMGMGMGLSVLLFTVKNRFFSPTRPTSLSLSTIGNIATLIFGLGFCLKNALWLKWRWREIDGRVQEFMQKAGSQFIVRRDVSVEDTTYTKEEKERMRKVKKYGSAYRFVQEDVFTVVPPIFSLFSSTQEMQIKSRAGSNNLDKVKEELKPWRDLLCEMTQPEHFSKFGDAELSMVGLRTRSIDRYSTLVSAVSCKTGAYIYDYDPEKNGEITVKFTSNSTRLVINKAEEFRQFLKTYFLFDPVSTELVS